MSIRSTRSSRRSGSAPAYSAPRPRSWSKGGRGALVKHPSDERLIASSTRPFPGPPQGNRAFEPPAGTTSTSVVSRQAGAQTPSGDARRADGASALSTNETDGFDAQFQASCLFHGLRAGLLHRDAGAIDVAIRRTCAPARRELRVGCRVLDRSAGARRQLSTGQILLRICVSDDPSEDRPRFVGSGEPCARIDAEPCS